MTKKRIFLAITLTLCVAIFAGAVYLFNEIFPKAKPIEYPEIDEVTLVSIGSNTSEGVISMNELYYEELFRHISEAEPTRGQAWNDYPTVRPYYCVEIQTAERMYRYFVYENGGQVYIESPYEGIYESETELLEWVLQQFE